MIYTKYRLSTDNPQFLIPVPGLLKGIIKANGNEEEMNGMTFNSYIIMLRDVSIKEVANEQHTTQSSVLANVSCQLKKQ